MSFPLCLVFDLDFTLWDCGGVWCDHSQPPYTCHADGRICDSSGAAMTLYPAVLDILADLQRREVVLAVASRTGQAAWAHELLQLHGIDHYFAQVEMYTTSKTRHLAALRDGLGIDYERMAFFDDEERNIRDVGALGVHCTHVTSGITAQQVAAALAELRT